MLWIVPTLFLTACMSDNVIEKEDNSLPTISIQSHGDESPIQEGFVEQFRAQVSDDDADFTELMVAWYIGEELVCDWFEADPAGASYCEMTFLPEDGRVVAEVRDPQGAGARDVPAPRRVL